MEGDRLVRLMGMVTDASNRLAILIDDLLDVSRIQSGQLALRTTTVDLAGLVGQVATGRAETLDDEHTLETELPESCPLEGDPDRLRQVVENLVDNAIKYSPEGGRISVSLAAEDGRAELSVADEGIGLPPGAADSIFEPFGRAANAAQRALPGMGLGLYICRNIVERHGGRIWAESPGEGQGTVVRVELPRAR
jgi:signal transduction histidine kinase